MSPKKETRVTIPMATNFIDGIDDKDFMTQVTSARGGRKYELDYFKAITPVPSVKSVTSIIDGSLRNYGLENWKAAHIRRGLAAQVGNTLSVADSEMIMTSADREAARSAAVGTDLHNTIDMLLKGIPIGEIGYDDEDWDSEGNSFSKRRDQLDPAVSAFFRWREGLAKDWKFIGSELGVGFVYTECNHDFHKTCGEITPGDGPPHGFAGVMDALFQLPNGGFVVVDWKTSSGIYNTAALQLSAYLVGLSGMLLTRGEKLWYVADDDEVKPPDIYGLIVRFVNGYPAGPDGKPDKTKEKIFENKLEIAEVDLSWAAMFLAITSWANADNTLETAFY